MTFVRSATAAAASVALTAGLALTVAVPAEAVSGLYANCTSLQKKFPHGLGRANARDRTSGTPVTTFTRSTKGYNKADRANGGLDGDNDGIACEKA